MAVPHRRRALLRAQRQFLGVQAEVDAAPSGLTPVIQTIWKPGERPETVIGQVNDQLHQRDRWNGPGTIDWTQVFRNLRRGIVTRPGLPAAAVLGVSNRGPMTANGICQMAARRDRQCGVSVHPHRFRHHFSRTWLDCGGAGGPQILLRYGAKCPRSAGAAKL